MYELIFGLIVLIGVIYIARNLLRYFSGSEKSAEREKTVYKYTAKDFIMTASERDFYIRLNQLVHDRYVVFPQVRLSALFDNRVKGQDWKHALRHINQKSVDYVLCTKDTLKVVYAIELDDPTHDQNERIIRDTEVERIFAEALIPLVRFRDPKNLTDDEIINAFISSRNNM